jgi:hypothetical protein
MHGRAAILRKQNRDQPMRFLWAFRYNPWRRTSGSGGLVNASHTQGRAYTHAPRFCFTKSRGLPCAVFCQAKKRTGLPARRAAWNYITGIIAFGNYSRAYNAAARAFCWQKNKF